MKLIFLDFDGVLNNTSNLDDRGTEGFKKFHIETDKLTYASLNNIESLTKLFIYCIRNDIKIVVSSSWSLFGLNSIKEKLSEVFGRYILDELFIDVTPYLIPSKELSEIPIRSIEIIRWMLDNNYTDNEYIIIDDETCLFDENDIENRLVHTNSELGFTINDLETVKRYFNLNLYDKHENVIFTLSNEIKKLIKELQPIKIKGDK